MNVDLPTTWGELAAGMTAAWTDTAAWLLTVDSVGKGALLALVVTAGALLGAAFTTNLGSPVDGPILTETERG